MTDHEMRVNLCEAMGYHRCKKYRGSQSAPWMGPDGAYASTIPNPVDDDRDAALLRAWCVGRRLCVVVDHRGDTNCCIVNVYRRVWADSADRSNHPAGHCLGAWSSFDEPDPLRRERLALCRAVCQALEVEHE